MLKKTVYEFGPDDVDNALRMHLKEDLQKWKLLLVTGCDPIFGVVCTDKVIEDACQAVVERQVQTKAGTVWHFDVVRDSDGRVSVSVSLV